jgi:hypothetical protein
MLLMLSILMYVNVYYFYYENSLIQDLILKSKCGKLIKAAIEKKELSENIFEAAEDSILHLLLTDIMMKYQDWANERGELIASQRRV